MKRIAIVALAALAVLPVEASADTWKDVPVVDTQCLSKVKADPDKHTKQCALQCSKNGYGLIGADGTFLKFDAAGNEKTVVALKASQKTDHLRATVTGQKDGDSIKVSAISIE